LARANPRLSRSLLSKRLQQLETAGIVDHVGDQYLLTPAGEDLQGLVFQLGEWGARWQFADPRESELDPELLMWWIHRRLDYSQVPKEPLVIEFRFREASERFWILKDGQGPSICTHDPGFGVDATVESDLSTLYQVWLGRLPLRSAIRQGRVELQGPSAMTRRLPRMLELSPIAGIVSSTPSQA
jgi:hypothetical protein